MGEMLTVPLLIVMFLVFASGALSSIELLNKGVFPIKREWDQKRVKVFLIVELGFAGWALLCLFFRSTP